MSAGHDVAGARGSDALEAIAVRPTVNRTVTSGLEGAVVAEPKQQRSRPEQVVTCRLGELRSHPSYVRLGFTVPTCKLSALAELGELAFREPLAITPDRIVIDGYARWELARLTGQLDLRCVEYDLTEEEAVRWLLQKHRRSNGMNDFCRILLALELEPCLKGRAVLNQRLGGRMKALSNLTEDTTLDVRAEIAEAAAVSVGSVTKVKQLNGNVRPELWEALRSGEISIHRGWGWRTESEEKQWDALRIYRNKKGINKAIRTLISRHASKAAATTPDVESLIKRLSRLKPDDRKLVRVSIVQSSGKAIFVSEELVRSLAAFQEPIPL
jgi:hypothetical protein